MMSVQQAIANGLVCQAVLYLRATNDYVTLTPTTPLIMTPGDMLFIITPNGEIEMTNTTDTVFTPFFEERDLL